ncbi:MAG: hypothetical protein N2260_03240 [Syntrophobacterales bacterium]|nr:hypothetical protein [Syntrophobacterales bacterium]
MKRLVIFALILIFVGVFSLGSSNANDNLGEKLKKDSYQQIAKESEVNKSSEGTKASTKIESGPKESKEGESKIRKGSEEEKSKEDDDVYKNL